MISEDYDDDSQWNFIPAKCFAWGALWMWVDEY